MKTQISILLALILGAPGAEAQEIEIHQARQGLYISFGRDLPYNFTYRISRSRGNEDFETAGEITAPVSKPDYEQRLNTFHFLFDPLPLPTERQIARTWSYIDESGSPDSLLISSVIEQLGLGLAWIDTMVERGKRYRYRIEKVQNDKVVSTSTTGETLFLPTTTDLPDAKYFRHKLIDGTILARWILLRKTGIAGFEVFRRDNLTGQFRQIDVPIGYAQNLDSTFIHVRDTLANRFEVYEYRLRPFDLFGNSGAFTETIKISSFTAGDFPILRSFKAIAMDSRRIKLKWSMDFEPFLRSIKVLRSMSFDTGFVEIAEVSPRDSTYVDVLPVSMENYYYRLKINGPDEVSISTSSTFILYESSLEPERPAVFTLRTVSGGVELYWEDLQRNVFGYYLFRKEGDEAFVQVSEPIPANAIGEYHYVDTASGLRGDRFYQYAVKTISDSHVLSQFSDTLSARPGIDVPIVTPKNLRGRKVEAKVYLLWDDLSLTESNLSGYRLFRKKSFEDTFRVLHDSLLNAETNHFIDSTTQMGYAYDYAVKAYSHFGAESAWSNFLQVKFFLRVPPPPPGIRIQKVSDGVRIVWGEVSIQELKSFDLFRHTPGEAPKLVGTIPADQHHYVDRDVRNGELYFYYLTSKTSSNVAGRPSHKVSVRY